jgi:UDP-3-O-[3-hydroxymyristoyl] glucosamine N-acyltransferase
MKMIREIIEKIRKKYYHYKAMRDPREVYGKLAPTAYLSHEAYVYNTRNLYLDEYTAIYSGALIMNSRSKFIMKRRSGASHNLTVVPGNHLSLVGQWRGSVTDEVKDKVLKSKEYDKDVIVDEDVWIGVNVTLLNGVHIGRGCIVGGGAVVRSSTPPYSIVVGNPAKVVGFTFSPEEIIEHEKALYSEKERLPLELLEKNYNKYYKKRLKEIAHYMHI